jgi:hypothetical protein
MATESIAMSDRDLLDAAARAVQSESRATAALLALLAEIDSRRLYLGEGFSSLFAYCTQVLHLSEPAAFSRIAAARAARRFSAILPRLAAGEISLTTVTLLAAHLTEENHGAVLDAARHKSKRDVERLVASLRPQPDVPSSVRRLPEIDRPRPDPGSMNLTPSVSTKVPSASKLTTTVDASQRVASRPVVAPIAPERYLMRITIGSDTFLLLERARDLLRHAVPSGDPAAIVRRALTVLVAQLERQKAAITHRPRPAQVARRPGVRRVPAAVRRAVWLRDQGRCTFLGARGRCREKGFLEYHHLRPFADGGPTSVENLQLRCRAHNAYEAGLSYG